MIKLIIYGHTHRQKCHSTSPHVCLERTVLAVPSQQLPHVYGGAGTKGVLCTFQGSIREARGTFGSCLARKRCHALGPKKDETAVHGCHCSGDIACDADDI